MTNKTFFTALFSLVLFFSFADSVLALTFTANDITGDNTNTTWDAVMGDVNGDTYLDIYVANFGQNKLWINDGAGNFTAMDIAGDTKSAQDAVMGDVNGDTYLDIYVANDDGQNNLWINDGAGNFTAMDITGDAVNSATAVMGDVDSDTYLDIYVGNEVGVQNKLWINDGAGNFTAMDITGDTALAENAVMGDVNGDTYLDIYAVNGAQNKLWINDGAGNFTAMDITGDTGSSQVTVMGDVDGDTYLDMYVANSSGQNNLWINDGAGNFTAMDITGDTGGSWGASMGDIDGDGDLDIHVANFGAQNNLWINDGSGSFTADNITGDTGNSLRSTLSDVDGDGGPDVYVGTFSTAQNHLWLNNSLTLTLEQAGAQTDPTSTDSATYTVTFSDPITIASFIAGDITLSGTTGTVTSGPTEVAPNDGTTFEFTVTGMTDGDTVTATIVAGGVDNAGATDTNLDSASTDNEVTYQVPLNVTLEQEGGQSDPTPVDSATYTVTFSDPITIASFIAGDITLSGTTGTVTSGPTEIAPNDGTTFEFEVTGMTDTDTVTATIAAGTVDNAGATTTNLQSTSVDNEITYIVPPPPSPPSSGGGGSNKRIRESFSNSQEELMEEDQQSVRENTELKEPENCDLSFIDIADIEDEIYIKILNCLNIISGKNATNSSFSPLENITRGEITKIALLVGGYLPDASATETPFSDVDGEGWLTAYIAPAQKKGIVQGYADGTFAPEQEVSRAEALAIFIRVLEKREFSFSQEEPASSDIPDVKEGNWYYDMVHAGVSMGLLNTEERNKRELFLPHKSLNRGETARLAVLVLELLRTQGSYPGPSQELEGALFIAGDTKEEPTQDPKEVLPRYFPPFPEG